MHDPDVDLLAERGEKMVTRNGTTTYFRGGTNIRMTAMIIKIRTNGLIKELLAPAPNRLLYSGPFMRSAYYQVPIPVLTRFQCGHRIVAEIERCAVHRST